MLVLVMLENLLLDTNDNIKISDFGVAGSCLSTTSQSIKKRVGKDIYCPDMAAYNAQIADIR